MKKLIYSLTGIALCVVLVIMVVSAMVRVIVFALPWLIVASIIAYVFFPKNR